MGRNEHFGIGVVEMMAAGLAVVAHDSAGPKEDIVVDWEGQPTGRRAEDAEGYAEAMGGLLAQTAQGRAGRERLAANGRRSVARFSDEVSQPRSVAFNLWFLLNWLWFSGQAFADAFAGRVLPLLT